MEIFKPRKASPCGRPRKASPRGRPRKASPRGRHKKIYKIFFICLLFFGLFFRFGGVENAKAEEKVLTKCCILGVKTTVNEKNDMVEIPKNFEDLGGFFFGLPPEKNNGYLFRGCRIEKEETEPCKEELKRKIKNIDDPDGGGFDEYHYLSIEGSIDCRDSDACMFSNPIIFGILKERGEVAKIQCDIKSKQECYNSENSAACQWVDELEQCVDIDDSSACHNMKIELGECGKGKCKIMDGKCIDIYQQWLYQAYGDGTTGAGAVGEFLPACARFGTCTDINDVVGTFLRITKEVFKYIGAIAFIFFIYGGGLMVLSFGNAEKFKKGQSVIIAAVIGMVIVFSGYFIVGFIMELMGVRDNLNVFR